MSACRKIAYGGGTVPIAIGGVWEKGYCYGQNGQERDKEIGNDIYTAEFWGYNSRLGRRWNLDPKPQINISDYAAMGNNPVFYTDIRGDEFAPEQSKKTAGKYKKMLDKAENKLKKQIKKLEEKNDKLYSSLKNKNFLKLDFNELIKNIDNLTEKKTVLKEIQNSKTELDKIAKSKIVVSLKYDPQPRTKGNSISSINVNYISFAELGHELKHVFQYINGQVNFDFNFDDGRAENLYDGNDEVEAFRRQYAINYVLSDPTKIDAFDTDQMLNTYNMNQIDLNWVLRVDYGYYRMIPIQDRRLNIERYNLVLDLIISLEQTLNKVNKRPL